MAQEIPLFPLRTVLFPGGPLPVRVFETRYLDMVGKCMKDGSPFGVTLIKRGREVGDICETHDVGTLATIIYFNRLANGVLGITGLGGKRFRILEKEARPNKLTVANIEVIEDDPIESVPELYQSKVDYVKSMMDQIGKHYINNSVPKDYQEAAWLGFRLAELLPLELDAKQELLEIQDPVVRLEKLQPFFDKYSVP